MRRGKHIRRRGLSMMEVVIATAIIGMVVVGGLNAAGQSARTATATKDRATAAWLADSLLAEMMAKPAFSDAGLGREGSEGSQTRSQWDDVNDYYPWFSPSPVDENGDAIPGTDGLARVASVQYANPTNLNSRSTVENDAIVLTVSVRRGTTTLATRYAVRTRAGADQ
ncbi:MAG: prepilin-type N-terminal cleavage/methylation domain-containing protein [Planctomycetota bacterium]